MKSILVPVDFSEVTQRVIETAEVIAGAFDAKLYVLHVLGLGGSVMSADVGWVYTRTDSEEEQEDLQGFVDRLRSRGHEAEAILSRGGPIVRLILDEIERLDADMVVMGSHGHGVLYDLIVGSVAEGVLRKAGCPVLMVPTVHEHRSRDSRGRKRKLSRSVATT